MDFIAVIFVVIERLSNVKFLLVYFNGATSFAKLQLFAFSNDMNERFEKFIPKKSYSYK